MKKYLTEDIIGPYSGIEYGKKGDRVEVIGNRSNMVLVENKGERFHVWPNKLTDISNPEKVIVEEEKNDVKQVWLPKEVEPEKPVMDLFGSPIQKKKTRKK